MIRSLAVLALGFLDPAPSVAGDAFDDRECKRHYGEILDGAIAKQESFIARLRDRMGTAADPDARDTLAGLLINVAAETSMLRQIRVRVDPSKPSGSDEARALGESPVMVDSDATVAVALGGGGFLARTKLEPGQRQALIEQIAQSQREVGRAGAGKDTAEWTIRSLAGEPTEPQPVRRAAKEILQHGGTLEDLWIVQARLQVGPGNPAIRESLVRHARSRIAALPLDGAKAFEPPEPSTSAASRTKKEDLRRWIRAWQASLGRDEVLATRVFSELDDPKAREAGLRLLEPGARVSGFELALIYRQVKGGNFASARISSGGASAAADAGASARWTRFGLVLQELRTGIIGALGGDQAPAFRAEGTPVSVVWSQTVSARPTALLVPSAAPHGDETSWRTYCRAFSDGAKPALAVKDKVAAAMESELGSILAKIPSLQVKAVPAETVAEQPKARRKPASKR